MSARFFEIGGRDDVFRIANVKHYEKGEKERKRTLSASIWNNLSAPEKGSNNEAPKLDLVKALDRSFQPHYLLNQDQFNVVESAGRGLPPNYYRNGYKTTNSFEFIFPVSISQQELEDILQISTKSNKKQKNSSNQGPSFDPMKMLFEQSRVLTRIISDPTAQTKFCKLGDDTWLKNLGIFALALDDRAIDHRSRQERQDAPTVVGFGISEADSHSLEPITHDSKYYIQTGQLQPVAPQNKTTAEKLDMAQISDLILSRLKNHLATPNSIAILLVYDVKKARKILELWDPTQKGVEIWKRGKGEVSELTLMDLLRPGNPSRERSRSPPRRVPKQEYDDRYDSRPSGSSYEARGGRDYHTNTPSRSSKGKVILLDVHELVLQVIPHTPMGYLPSVEEMARYLSMQSDSNPAITLIQIWKYLSLDSNLATLKSRHSKPLPRQKERDENGNLVEASAYSSDEDDFNEPSDDDSDSD